MIKAGVEIRRVQMNQGKTASGTISFSSLNAFEADQVNTAKYTEAEPINGLRKTVYFGYIQDEFKWTPDFTVNLGARYSFFNIFHEIYGRPDPFDFATCGSAGFCGVGAAFGEPTYRDLDPRIALGVGPGVAGRANGHSLQALATYHQDGQLDDQNVPEGNEVASFALSRKDHPRPDLSHRSLSSPTSPASFPPHAMERRRKDMYVTQWGLSVQQTLPDRSAGNNLLRRQQGHPPADPLLCQRHQSSHRPASLSAIRSNCLARQREQQHL